MPFSRGAIWAACAAPLFAVGAIVYNVYTRRTYRYFITSRRSVFCGGIIVYYTQSIPHEMTTSFEVTQSIVERAAGVSTLRIMFAGLSTPRKTEIEFKGLRDAASPAQVLAKVRLSATADKR